MTEQVLPDENKLIAERRAKLEHIRTHCPANGHPNNFDRKHKAADIQAEFGHQTKQDLEGMGIQRSIAGRIMAKRGPFWCCKTSAVVFKLMRVKMFKRS